MMDISSPLAKKRWTGKEVGQALIASLLNDMEHQGEPDYKPLFRQADLNRMESSLDTKKNILAYNVYTDIYKAILDTFEKGQTFYQQFGNGYYRYFSRFDGAFQADKALADIERYPLIMTKGQYKKARSETLAYIRGRKSSFYDILFTVLFACISALEAKKEDRIPPAVLLAMYDTQIEPATNKRILSSYNKDMGKGYYQLPDGRRSDQISKEEWQKALLATACSHFTQDKLLFLGELLYKGEDAIDAIRKTYREKTGEELGRDDEDLLADITKLADGETNAALRQIMGKLILCVTGDPQPEWHYYEDPPEGLTKYDIVSKLLGRYNGEHDGDLPKKDQIKEFKQDYPALYAALEAYIKETVPTAENLKPIQYHRNTITYGELTDSGIIGYEGFSLSDADIIDYLQSKGVYHFSNLQIARESGIAVILNPSKDQLTQSGEYARIAPPLRRLYNIDALAKLEPQNKELEFLLGALVMPALSYLYAYNALMLLIGDVYDIDGMEAACIDTSLFEKQLDAFNSLLYTFYATVYGDRQEKARKRELIKKLFQPISYEAEKPTAEAIEAVKAKLTKAGISAGARTLLSNFPSLIDELRANDKGGC